MFPDEVGVPSEALLNERRCCALGPDHPLWRGVFRAYGLTRQGERDQAIRKVLRQDPLLTVEEVVEHMRWHRPVQPLSTTRPEARLPFVELSDGDLLILDLIGRLDELSVTAAVSMTGRTRESLTWTFTRLVRRDMLRRVKLAGNSKRRRVVFMLTPLGRRALEAHAADDYLDLRCRVVVAEDSIGKMPLHHDAGVGELLGGLVADARDHPGRNGVELSVDRASLLGSRQLRLAHQPPAWWRGNLRVAAPTATRVPDATIALGVRGVGDSTAMDVSVPLFIEFDTGSKRSTTVVEQMWLWAVLANAVRQPTPVHWPALAEVVAAGWRMPVLFACDRVTVLDLDLRAERIAVRMGILRRKFAEELGKSRLEGRELIRPPLWICSAAELATRGWDVPVIDLFADAVAPSAGPDAAPGGVTSQALWSALRDSVQPYLAQWPVSSHEVLALNPDLSARSGGMLTASVSLGDLVKAQNERSRWLRERGFALPDEPAAAPNEVTTA